MRSDEREAVALTSIPMVRVPACAITMIDEGTKRTWRVELQSFAIAITPVTTALYQQVMTAADPHASTSEPTTPVTDVTWLDAIAFCNLLSDRDGLPRVYSDSASSDGFDVVRRDVDGYRLPTEAEWEVACRAGSNEARYGLLDDIAWYAGNSGGHVHEVGAKQANAWGLNDMIGNVWEWCWDLFDPTVYGAYRVFRGGGFADQQNACRASARRKSHPTFKIDDIGFRVARSTGQT